MEITGSRRTAMTTNEGKASLCQQEEEAYGETVERVKQTQRLLEWVNSTTNERNVRASHDKPMIAEWERDVKKAMKERNEAIEALESAFSALNRCRKKHGIAGDPPEATAATLGWNTIGQLHWADDHWVHSGIHRTASGAYHDTQFKLDWLDSTGWQVEEWDSVVFYRAGNWTYEDMVQNGFKEIQVWPEDLLDRQRLRAIAERSIGIEAVT
jgi:hypothetical protein